MGVRDLGDVFAGRRSGLLFALPDEQCAPHFRSYSAPLRAGLPGKVPRRPGDRWPAHRARVWAAEKLAFLVPAELRVLSCAAEGSYQVVLWMTTPREVPAIHGGQGVWPSFIRDPPA